MWLAGNRNSTAAQHRGRGMQFLSASPLDALSVRLARELHAVFRPLGATSQRPGQERVLLDAAAGYGAALRRCVTEVDGELIRWDAPTADVHAHRVYVVIFENVCEWTSQRPSSRRCCGDYSLRDWFAFRCKRPLMSCSGSYFTLSQNCIVCGKLLRTCTRTHARPPLPIICIPTRICAHLLVFAEWRRS